MKRSDFTLQGVLNKLPSGLIGILLGIIGALVGYFSIVLTLPSEVRKLETLLNESKTLDNIDSRLKDLEARMDAMDMTLLSQTGAPAYLNTSAAIPDDLEGKQRIYESIAGATNNRHDMEDLYGYVLQKSDPNISQTAYEKFASLAQIKDIDALVFFGLTDVHLFPSAQTKVVSFAKDSASVRLIVTSVLKHMHRDDLMASYFIESLYGIDDPPSRKYRDAYLPILLRAARDKKLPITAQLLEKLVIENRLVRRH